MLSRFLDCVLTKSGRDADGCGMSTRPSYYSGRGANTTDLSAEKLQKIWTAINTHRGAKDAETFVRMVESLRVLSATDFLIALASLDANDFKWEQKMLPTAKGIHATDEGSAMGTVFSVMAGSMSRDETRAIKDPFLRMHGRKIKPSKHGYDGWYA